MDGPYRAAAGSKMLLARDPLLVHDPLCEESPVAFSLSSLSLPMKINSSIEEEKKNPRSHGISAPLSLSKSNSVQPDNLALSYTRIETLTLEEETLAVQPSPCLPLAPFSRAVYASSRLPCPSSPSSPSAQLNIVYVEMAPNTYRKSEEIRDFKLFLPA